MRSLIATTVMVVVASNDVAFAEQWQCDYKGKWSTTGTSDSGLFDWKLKWTSKPGGWEVAGNYKDKYGESTLDGSCENKQCTLTQAYFKGELDGNKYTWAGKYTDKWESKSRTTSTFTGTWRAHHNANHGVWNATAVCNKLGG
jgi:hypothetical protein